MTTTKFRILEYDSNKYRSQLLAFCNQCQLLGYVNNSSLKLMKLEPNQLDAKFWCLFSGAKIVGVAGAHKQKIGNQNYIRLLFRGCILPKLSGRGLGGGLNKNHLNSIIFKNFTPLQIKWGKNFGINKFIITTNTPTNQVDPSGKMFKSNRVMKILSKQGYLNLLHKDIELYNCTQNVWMLTEIGLFKLWSIKL